MKKIVIAGGSGFLGNLLTGHLTQQGYEVVILSRKHQEDQPAVRHVKWDAKTIGSWQAELEGCKALINLSGKSVDCRYNERNKQLIYDSRISATIVLGEAIGKCQSPPPVWINASSATIYRHEEHQDMDEKNGVLGTGFSVDVCKKWEQAFLLSQTPNTRKVTLRIAIVLGPTGGAFQPLQRLARYGLGGKQGSGTQYFSWIHAEDFINIVDRGIHTQMSQGVYNVSSPFPIPNKSFMQALRKAMHRPWGLPIPKWLLKLGARIIHTEPELVLKSRRVIPRRLLVEGYNFKYPTIDKALKSLIK